MAMDASTGSGIETQPRRVAVVADSESSQEGSRGGRPFTFDARDYKNRNVIERAFNHSKNWRGLATRYDKHALIFRAGVVLASIMLRLIPRDDDRPQLVVYAPDDGLLRRSLAPEMEAEARTFASRLNAASHGPAG